LCYLSRSKALMVSPLTTEMTRLYSNHSENDRPMVALPEMNPI
jgi:hypothetical protein